MNVEYSNFSELRDRLENDAEGVLTTEMWRLRDAYPAGKLGINVVTNMSEKLSGLGIGHIPADLPRDQNAVARVYLKSSPSGKLIDAALDVDVEKDAILRRFTNERADDILRRIRELVCD